MIYKVYLYPDYTYQNVKTIICDSLEKAEILEQVGREDGYYKYMLAIIDNVYNMPLSTKTVYYEYDYSKDKQNTK